MSIGRKPMEATRVAIFDAKPERFKYVGQVKVLDIFQNNTRDFHDEGLFSTVIFGKVGTPDRLKRFGNIDVRVPILHPRIFTHLCNLKQLYREIMAGREFAIWNEAEGDFEKSDAMNGKTGYHFFTSHLAKLKIKRTTSAQRDGKIEVVRMNLDKALTTRILVIPAGIRDLEVDEHGGVDQSEINDFYRSILKIANTLSTVHDLNSPIIDKARFTMQLAFNELHDFIMTNTIKGKGSFFASKLARRRIRYSTRGVFAATSAGVKHLDATTNLTPNHTQIGLFQEMKATEPLMIHHLKTAYLDRVFSGEGSAWLIDPKTLTRVEVQLKPRTTDRWTTVEGLTKIINQFKNPRIRNQYVMVDKHYLGLVFKKDGQYRLVFSSDEIPTDQPEYKDYLFPITYGELFFIVCARYQAELPADITRYPISGSESVYPSYNYLMTTSDPLEMVELDDMWQPTGIRTTQYPNTDSTIWYDCMGPHPNSLGGLGGDRYHK